MSKKRKIKKLKKAVKELVYVINNHASVLSNVTKRNKMLQIVLKPRVKM